MKLITLMYFTTTHQHHPLYYILYSLSLMCEFEVYSVLFVSHINTTRCYNYNLLHLLSPLCLIIISV